MYINKIHIQNYRNYNDFTMNFHKGETPEKQDCYMLFIC